MIRTPEQMQLRIAELEFWEGVMAHEADLLRTRIAELEAEIADLIHPHDLAAYRAKKSLHK